MVYVLILMSFTIRLVAIKVLSIATLIIQISVCGTNSWDKHYFS